MSRSIEKLIASEVVRFTTLAVETLASKYEFKASEAIELLGLAEVEVARKTGGPGGKAKTAKEPKEKRDLPKCVLPFCGICVPGWCEGVRLNHGLYTQCQMLKEGDTKFCKTCNKQAAANATGKPTYGTIQDRIATGANYKDPKGKSPVNYGNVMDKLDITRETAMAEAEKYGMVIPEEQFAVIKRKQGRPKTKTTTSDTESEGGEPKAPKKRGRPKKTTSVVENASPGDDLIASLVASAKAGDKPTKTEAKTDAKVTETPAKTPKKVGRPKVVRTPEEEAAHKAKLAENRKKKAAAKKEQEEAEAKLAAEAKAAEEAKAKAAAEEAKAKAAAEMKIEPLEEDSDADEEGPEVEEFEFEGKMYYKDADNYVYDTETEDKIGKFNEEAQKIEPLNDAKDTIDDIINVLEN